jgi:putative flavoprotein involved in K+ transport
MLTARLAGTAPSSFALEGEATEADCVVDAWLTFETRGSVKLKSGVNIAQIKPKSVLLTDGTELEADLIVYATGYGSMNQWLADLISPEMADRLGKVWGLGSDTPKDPGPWEGELRNMWKPTHVPHLWVQGGNLHQNRHYSQFMGLQLKARYEGIPTPVYGQAQVHHLR